ncbi:MAG: hypothetical protein CMQ40_12430 [Gammaproteobacteria bacterium]|nr:hypothetical protein [Gammaproteobacteria bacterium]
MRKLRGFTLIEVLVVLLLTSIASAFLFDASSNLAHLIRKIERTTQVGKKEKLATTWVRDLVGASIAVEPMDKLYAFAGEPGFLRGVSSSSIFEESGKLAHYSLFLQSRGKNTVLIYQERENSAIELMERKGEVSFYYENTAGNRYRSWPPRKEFQGSLPRLVVLAGTEGMPLLIKINQRRLPIKDLRDLL